MNSLTFHTVLIRFHTEVRSWAASLSNRKSFVSTTHFKVAIAGIKNLLHLSNEELASFSLGSFSYHFQLESYCFDHKRNLTLLFWSQKKFNLIVLVTKANY